jgi:predicted lipid carrier protein YhbT
MQNLATPASAGVSSNEQLSEATETKESELNRAMRLADEGRHSEAFFIARRLAAEGDTEAQSFAESIREAMSND